MNKTKFTLKISIAAIVAAFAWNCGNDGDGGGGGGTVYTGDKNKDECLAEMSQNKSNTISGIMQECGVSKEEVLTVIANIPQGSKFGNCEISDINPGKTLEAIEIECEETISFSSSSSENSSSSVNTQGSSQSSSSNTIPPQPPSSTQSSSSSLYSGSYTGEYGSFIDERDDQEYKTVVIGTQTWMAENLNYYAEGKYSPCYNEDETNCKKYGRLYNWAAAMDLESNCNRSSSCPVDLKHQGMCPSGWHIPTNEEWKTLIDYIGGAGSAGRHLKATSGWNDCSLGKYDTLYNYSTYSCDDTYGFAALPGGDYTYTSNNFGKIGSYGWWWSATNAGNASDGSSYYAYGLEMYVSGISYYNNNSASMKPLNKGGTTGISYTSYYSVRCLKD